jgi:uncharacterized protein (UPF0332 family)
MTPENIEEYIKYRFHRAEESVEEALILTDNGMWNAVINRLYYSCFYAVIALLLKQGIETKTHKGTKTQFGQHFISTGKIDKSFGKFYTKLFNLKQKGDYGDFYDYDEETAKPLIEQVRIFIREIEKHINPT